MWKLCAFPGGVRIHLVNVAGSTAYSMIDDTGLKYLPDCTGWDWEPPKQIEPPEGYRLLTEGEVILVGDMFLENGKWDILHPEAYHIGKKWREELYLPYARKIEKYRPFANAAEFAPHRDKWVRWKASNGTANESLVNRVHTYSDTVVWVGAASVGKDYREAFELLEFEDGSPFGVKE